MTIKYKLILYWSYEDSAFIAEVPECPGCAADGATRQEALAVAEADSRMARNSSRTWPPHTRIGQQ
jgi:hypothetical protein